MKNSLLIGQKNLIFFEGVKGVALAGGKNKNIVWKGVKSIGKSLIFEEKYKGGPALIEILHFWLFSL